MLPYSHQPDSNLQTQRQNRLKTQAALYMNGYQRDWFGFNQGSLIGSFDGVSWFAIGARRRVTARTNKLYLAINSPYVDLASNNSFSVNVRYDTGNVPVSDFDYDPTISMFDPYQNSGATCQYYHQCNVDRDCVSKLGWEYRCADIDEFKTSWPSFDNEAQELSLIHI